MKGLNISGIASAASGRLTSVINSAGKLANNGKLSSGVIDSVSSKVTDMIKGVADEHGSTIQSELGTSFNTSYVDVLNETGIAMDGQQVDMEQAFNEMYDTFKTEG